jgi:hypothetical protein
MSIEATHDFGATWPSFVWDLKAMRDVAEVLRTSLVQRTFFEGLDVNDNGMKAYSTKPVVIYRNSETARRLKPKGGTPWKGQRGPNKGRVVGRFYKGGYAQYKEESRKGLKPGKSIEVDLILSGQLSRSIGVQAISKTGVTITPRGAAVAYAGATHLKRNWWGISPRNNADLVAALPEIIGACISRAVAGKQ